MLSVFLLPGFLPKYACPLALLEPAGSVSAEIYILFPLCCAAPPPPPHSSYFIRALEKEARCVCRTDQGAICVVSMG